MFGNDIVVDDSLATPKNICILIGGPFKIPKVLYGESGRQQIEWTVRGAEMAARSGWSRKSWHKINFTREEKKSFQLLSMNINGL